MEKWKFLFLNVLIHGKLFHRNLLLNALYAYLFSFLFPWSSMRKFPCAVWKAGTFPHIDKEETFFFLENCTLVWSKFFYIIIFSWDHKIFLKVWKFSCKFFWEERYQLLMCSYDISTFWLLITLWNMPKGLVT